MKSVQVRHTSKIRPRVIFVSVAEDSPKRLARKVLLREKQAQGMPLEELLARCGVGRSTFYKYMAM